MQTSVVDTPTPDCAERTVARPFVLFRPHGTVIAGGIEDRFDRADAAAAALRTGRVQALVGALPFDPAHPVALTAPHTLERTSGPVGVPSPVLPAMRVVQAIPAENTHLDRVTAALALLRSDDDDLVKVVLARALRLRSELPVRSADLVARLAGNDPAGNGFAVDLTPAGDPWRGRQLIGSSPEVLIRRRGDRVTAHPLAGSAPRHADPASDRVAGERLAESAKNRAEHAHVVRALRSALEPLCTDLDIPRSPSLTSTRQLWHLGTSVSGRLRDPSTTALDLALAVHPTPAVCGTPTEAAREFIRDVEGDRGFYAGAVGWCDSQGDGEWMVTIRCAVLDADGTTLTAYAGGGIVADSDPADELAETSVKFGTVLDAFGVRR